jgi:hypothetical protein
MKKALAWALGEAGSPQRLNAAAIDLEKHLEDWVDADVDIVADDVLLIGRQIPTAYGTVIDLLGMDAEGNLVIIELKRDQTLRETVAQGIEYAAWASKLLYDDVIAIASKRFPDQDGLAVAFEKRFNESLPETLNAGQRIILVAPSITESTAGVIEYLSETYRVPINGVAFDVFAMAGQKLLVRHAVREEAAPPPPPSKKRRKRTIDEFKVAAEENGVEELVEHLSPCATSYLLLSGL